MPDLLIEVADTSIANDKGEKRLQYEELAILEYWIIDVQNMKIIAFLEEALRRSRQENQSAVNAWLMEQVPLVGC